MCVRLCPPWMYGQHDHGVRAIVDPEAPPPSTASIHTHAFTHSSTHTHSRTHAHTHARTNMRTQLGLGTRRVTNFVDMVGASSGGTILTGIMIVPTPLLLSLPCPATLYLRAHLYRPVGHVLAAALRPVGHVLAAVLRAVGHVLAAVLRPVGHVLAAALF